LSRRTVAPTATKLLLYCAASGTNALSRTIAGRHQQTV
jgi:hypothetical protein